MFSNKLRRMVAILIVILLLVIAGVAGIFLGYNYVTSQETRFESLESDLKSGALVINRDTPNAVMLVIDSGDDTSAIAEKLYDAGLINNSFVFLMLSKFNGFDGGYLSGTHFLTFDLSYDEIMYMLCQEPEVIKITFTEGMTYLDIKNKLLDSGLEFDPKKLDQLMNSQNLFVGYDFVSQIAINEDRDYILNGYLFPDTYYFDMNASEEEIIDTFLRNTENKLSKYEDLYNRAEKIGMTMDQVLTLASIIQQEAKLGDMRTVSCVFHNRLRAEDPANQKLESCATINYLRQMDGLEKVWSADNPADRMRESVYNTYLYAGLPPGPICMPGLDAITAALYPTDENYMYFCATGIEGGSAFAVTLDEHNANVEKYRPNWTDDEVHTVEETTIDEG